MPRTWLCYGIYVYIHRVDTTPSLSSRVRRTPVDVTSLVTTVVFSWSQHSRLYYAQRRSVEPVEHNLTQTASSSNNMRQTRRAYCTACTKVHNTEREQACDAAGDVFYPPPTDGSTTVVQYSSRWISRCVREALRSAIMPSVQKLDSAKVEHP